MAKIDFNREYFQKTNIILSRFCFWKELFLLICLLIGFYNILRLDECTLLERDIRLRFDQKTDHYLAYTNHTTPEYLSSVDMFQNDIAVDIMLGLYLDPVANQSSDCFGDGKSTSYTSKRCNNITTSQSLTSKRYDSIYYFLKGL